MYVTRFVKGVMYLLLGILIKLERTEGNLLGPFLELEVHIGHIRVIPKESQPGQ